MKNSVPLHRVSFTTKELKNLVYLFWLEDIHNCTPKEVWGGRTGWLDMYKKITASFEPDFNMKDGRVLGVDDLDEKEEEVEEDE